MLLSSRFTVAWQKQALELKLLIALFSLENLLLSLPLWILSLTVGSRNSYLEEFFPPLRAERASTSTILALAAPNGTDRLLY